jgi:hypothetical protein
MCRREGDEIRRFSKRLEDELYVASEANATPLRSYAPLSNFSAVLGVSLPWTPETQVLSQPGIPGLLARTPTKHLISDGFLS